jgi:undecaprenyl-diphosphatase
MYSMTLAASVVPLAWHSPRTRYPVLAASMLYVLGVGVSRVYLHAHIPADIVAGWCAALAWTAGFRILWVTVAPAILQASRAGNDLDLHPLA